MIYIVILIIGLLIYSIITIYNNKSNNSSAYTNRINQKEEEVKVYNGLKNDGDSPNLSRDVNNKQQKQTIKDGKEEVNPYKELNIEKIVSLVTSDYKQLGLNVQNIFHYCRDEDYGKYRMKYSSEFVSLRNTDYREKYYEITMNLLDEYPKLRKLFLLNTRFENIIDDMDGLYESENEKKEIELFVKYKRKIIAEYQYPSNYKVSLLNYLNSFSEEKATAETPRVVYEQGGKEFRAYIFSGFIDYWIIAKINPSLFERMDLQNSDRQMAEKITKFMPESLKFVNEKKYIAEDIINDYNKLSSRISKDMFGYYVDDIREEYINKSVELNIIIYKDLVKYNLYGMYVDKIKDTIIPGHIWMDLLKQDRNLLVFMPKEKMTKEIFSYLLLSSKDWEEVGRIYRDYRYKDNHHQFSFVSQNKEDAYYSVLELYKLLHYDKSELLPRLVFEILEKFSDDEVNFIGLDTYLPYGELQNLKIDFHKYKIKEVVLFLNKLKSIKTVYFEVEVIHGFNMGTSIKDYIRFDFSEKDIVVEPHPTNAGRTKLIFNASKKRSTAM